MLVFDSWLPGFKYIEHFINNSSVELIYVHTSSLQTGSVQKEYQEFRRTIEIPKWVKDFKEYDCSLKNLFEIEKPDLVLVTSLHFFECRSCILYARKVGIKTAFIPHGIFKSGGSAQLREKRFNLIKRLISKLPRVIYYLRMFYIFHREIYGVQRLKLGFLNLLELIFRYYDWQWRPSQSVQEYYKSCLSIGCVFSQDMIEQWKLNYGKIVAEARFKVTYTLDCMKFDLKDKDVTSSQLHTKKYCYFISSVPSSDLNTEKAIIIQSHLDHLYAALSRLGFDKIVYRPHPAEPEFFTNIVCNRSFISRSIEKNHLEFTEADIVAGWCSSLLMVPIILGKHMITVTSELINYEKPYWEPLISYKRIEINLDSYISEQGVEDLANYCEQVVIQPLPQISNDPLSAILGK